MKETVQIKCNNLRIAFEDDNGYYQKYSGTLYGVILKLTTDQNLAGVLLTDSFIAIYKEVREFDATKGRLFSWMLRIVVRQCQQKLGLSREIIKEKLAIS